MRTRAAITLLLLTAAACSEELPQGDNGGTRNPPGNRAPIINPVERQSLQEGQRIGLVFAVDDPDGDTLFLGAEGLPEGAVFDPIQGTLSYEPDYDVVSGAEGSLRLPDITVTVDDGFLSASTAVSITVRHVNRRPFFLASDGGSLTGIEAEVEPAAERRVAFQVIDADDDPITLSLLESPAYARLDGETLVLAPAEADRGSVVEFGLAADDGSERAELPVRVVVGSLDAELPAPTGLHQSDADGDIPVGEQIFEGEIAFGANVHGFEFGPLRLQIELAPVGVAYEEGDTAIGDPIDDATPPSVALEVEGGDDYRWRARYLSDEFGAGPYTTFGGNTESDTDLAVSIIPETHLDEVPGDPSPIDVTFGFWSPNVEDFECAIDGGDWLACSNWVDCCPGDDCPSSRAACERDPCTCAIRAITGLGNGQHRFSVRGTTRDGLVDPEPPLFEWDALDLPAPQVFFTSTPSDPVGCSAEFRFSSSDAAATFECRLDPPPPRGPGSFAPCRSPRTVTLTEDGSYTFHARAINIVGVAGEPATHPFSSNCE